jgi:hypothetical protein
MEAREVEFHVDIVRAGLSGVSGYDPRITDRLVQEIPMRAPRLVLALVLALVGLVWIGQGLGLVGGSFMTGSAFWALVGVILVALAAVVLLIERRRGLPR